MSHTPHELADEFPADVSKIHALKSSDAHFSRLVDEYHAVNRTIHRAETRVEAIAEETEAQLRKQRMTLKDDIARLLRASA